MPTIIRIRWWRCIISRVSWLNHANIIDHWISFLKGLSLANGESSAYLTEESCVLQLFFYLRWGLKSYLSSVSITSGRYISFKYSWSTLSHEWFCQSVISIQVFLHDLILIYQRRKTWIILKQLIELLKLFSLLILLQYLVLDISTHKFIINIADKPILYSCCQIFQIILQISWNLLLRLIVCTELTATVLSGKSFS